MIIIGNSNVDCFASQGRATTASGEPVRVQWVGALKIGHFAPGQLIGQKVRAVFASEPGWKFLSLGIHDIARLYAEPAGGLREAAEQALLQQYEPVLAELARPGPAGWLVFPQPVHEIQRPDLPAEEKARIARHFNHRVGLICRRYGLAVVHPLEEMLRPDGLPPADHLQADGIHLNHRGAAAYLDAIAALTGEVIDFPAGETVFAPRTETESFCFLLLHNLNLPKVRVPSRAELLDHLTRFMQERAAARGLDVPVGPDTGLASSGLFDSLDLVELYTAATAAMHRELEFGVDLRALDTIGNIADFLLQEAGTMADRRTRILPPHCGWISKTRRSARRCWRRSSGSGR